MIAIFSLPRSIMEQNPYEPPRAALDPRNREPGSIPKAVAIGTVIDIGGTTLGSIVFGIIYSVVLGAQGRSEAEIQKIFESLDPFSALGLVLLAMGMTMSALGGYQCAAIANRNSYLAPGIMSLISVGYGATMNDGQLDLPQLLLMSGLTVAAILGGAALHIRKLVTPPKHID
jgi:hypothetical protein